MRKIQSQGVHHITLVGADRQTSIDFWDGVLGMPFVFEQPNLDNPNEGHLYFDPGDVRLITVFTDETRTTKMTRLPQNPGQVHHIAFAVSQASFWQAVDRFDPPAGATHTDVLTAAHHIRVAAGAATIDQNHIADAVEQIAHAKAQSLSSDRSVKNPF